MIASLHKYRFELFFISIIFILFGSLFFPKEFYVDKILPLLFLINISSGLLFFLFKKKKSLITIIIFIIVLVIFLIKLITQSNFETLNYVRLVAYFMFYSLLTFEIIHQVWSAKTVNKSVIFGLMNGYIALGLLGFFTFFCIELLAPGSFNGIDSIASISEKINDLIYYSYITLLTIGYGDITPATDLTQKASVLVGMVGQFYLVIVTAVVIEKYIRHNHD